VTPNGQLGILAAAVRPNALADAARRVEALGFAELWIPEDYYETGAFSAAAIALGATERLPVGIGVASLLTRHPAVLAMEIATLADAFPGRLLAGFGTGLMQSIDDMGLRPTSPLGAVRASFDAVTRLLRGDAVSGTFGPHSLGNGRLAHPPAQVPPRLVGGLGPKMMELAGELADAVILSSLASPAYVRWARERIAAGAERAGRETLPEIRVFSWLGIGADAAAARAELRGIVSGALGFIGPGPLTAADGYDDELRTLIDRARAAGGAVEVPDHWLDQLVITGDAAQRDAAIRARLDAGADRVVLCPTPGARFAEMIDLLGEETP
jgi:alkanesulfonate monooxygenase SsuD/methylene tetrahydromethanopterin reductase-like flavin-dependent oxidoreductase (luciferase family)